MAEGTAGNGRSRRPAAGDVDALLARTAAGDPAAFSDLYDVLAPAVLGITRRVLRDATMAEEAAQEVMLGVWQGASAYDAARGSARAWILTMAHRRAVDRVRSEHALRRRQHRHLVATHAPEYDEVSEVVGLSEEHDAVRAMLGVLTARQRQAVLAVYFDGCSYRQAAERLEVPVSTVKARLHEAVRRLRGALTDPGFAPAV